MRISINQFHVYIQFRTGDGKFPTGTPWYVGKGLLGRARMKNRVSQEHMCVLPCETEQAAFECERFLIKLFGRIDLGTGCLRNRTDGGEGTSGLNRVFSSEHRAKLGAAHIGNTSARGAKRSAETRAKLSAAIKAYAKTHKNSFRGRTHTDGVRAKLSAANKGRKPTEDARAKMSAAQMGNTNARGRTHTDDTKARMSAAHIGLVRSPAHCASLSAAGKGRVFSPEHCTKLSASAKIREAAKRLQKISLAS
ncbi:MAG: NUMOD3 domain-containing DNA-binding protein [Candidatus Acidiferrales bacterium]